MMQSPNSLKEIFRRKIWITIIVLIIAAYIIYCWVTLFTGNFIINWRHYTGLILFIPLPVLLFTNTKAAIIGTGIYLLLIFFRILAITYGIRIDTVGISSLNISGINIQFLWLLVLYLILNGNALINMRLDYKRKKLIDKNRF